MGRGRCKLIGDNMDQKVQAYIKNVRAGGGNISATVVMGAAKRIMLYFSKKKLVKLINRHSLLKRMDFVRRKATTAMSKYTNANFAAVKNAFL